MFLVDTSVWIDYLRRRDAQHVRWLKDILDRDFPFGITSDIYREVLQGAEDEASFERLGEFFGSQTFYHPLDPVASHADAARLYFRCRRIGLTVRSSADCLIARIAVEHDLLLLHNDRDFDALASVEPDLRLYSGGLGQRGPAEMIHDQPPAPYDADR